MAVRTCQSRLIWMKRGSAARCGNSRLTTHGFWNPSLAEPLGQVDLRHAPDGELVEEQWANARS